MDRRSFGKLLFAAGATAALPLPSLGATAQAGSRAGYVWAVAMAKAKGTVSPEILAKGLKVTPHVAEGLYARLLSRGVITQSAGIGTAVAPVFQAQKGFAVAAQAVAQAASPAKPDIAPLREAAREVLIEQDRPEASPEPACDTDPEDSLPEDQDPSPQTDAPGPTEV